MFIRHINYNRMIDKDLQAVGLQEKEAKVYLAALELGKGTAQQIARKADLKRPTTYVIVEELMQQGLVSSYYEGKKQYFVAEHPDRLGDLLKKEQEEVEKKQAHLKAILPQLQSINNRQTDKPVVKYYEGKEGILTMVAEHAKSSFGKTAYSVHSRDMLNKVLSVKETEGIANDRVEHHIKMKSLYTWSQGTLPNRSDTEGIRLSETDLGVSCDIAVFGDRIRIASFKDRLIGVVIEDKEIAKSFQAVFELAWKWAQEHQIDK